MMVLPIDTWPSPPITTFCAWRTERMVVPRYCSKKSSYKNSKVYRWRRWNEKPSYFTPKAPFSTCIWCKFCGESRKAFLLFGDLKPGMYVSELDRPWLETPFLFQSFKWLGRGGFFSRPRVR